MKPYSFRSLYSNKVTIQIDSQWNRRKMFFHPKSQIKCRADHEDKSRKEIPNDNHRWKEG